MLRRLFTKRQRLITRRTSFHQDSYLHPFIFGPPPDDFCTRPPCRAKYVWVHTYIPLHVYLPHLSAIRQYYIHRFCCSTMSCNGRWGWSAKGKQLQQNLVWITEIDFFFLIFTILESFLGESIISPDKDIRRFLTADIFLSVDRTVIRQGLSIRVPSSVQTRFTPRIIRAFQKLNSWGNQLEW